MTIDEEVIDPPTYWSEGIAHVTQQCTNRKCGYHKEYDKAIPRRQRTVVVSGGGGGGGGGGEPAAGKGLFVLDKVEKVVDSEGGQVRVVRGQPWPPASFMHIGFITMEPKTLFVPQYMDSNLILFVQRGG
jgi:hypothetical protein